MTDNKIPKADGNETSTPPNKPNTNKNKENVTCWPGTGRGRWLTPPPDGPPFFFASLDDLWCRTWVRKRQNNSNEIDVMIPGRLNPCLLFFLFLAWIGIKSSSTLHQHYSHGPHATVNKTSLLAAEMWILKMVQPCVTWCTGLGRTSWAQTFHQTRDSHNLGQGSGNSI